MRREPRAVSCRKSNDSRHDHQQVRNRSSHHLEIVVKGVAKQTCLSMQCGPFLLQARGDRGRPDTSHAPAGVSAVDVSINGIELQDRESVTAIREGREPTPAPATSCPAVGSSSSWKPKSAPSSSRARRPLSLPLTCAFLTALRLSPLRRSRTRRVMEWLLLVT